VSPAEQRRAWAYAMISRCHKPPAKYGSAEWLALPDGPEKVAAVVLAAEAWAIDGDTLLERLEAEVLFEREAFKMTEDAAYLARAEAHRQEWTGAGFRPDPTIAADIDREWREWVGGDAA
jgi:PHD/YefM family antitoxin component YafN of YafNO toxin-antitoxin module